MTLPEFVLPDPEPGELKVSIRDAAEACGLTVNKVNSLIRRKVLPAYILPGMRRGRMVYVSQVRACADNRAVVG